MCFCYMNQRICDQSGICDQFLHCYRYWRIFYQMLGQKGRGGESLFPPSIFFNFKLPSLGSCRPLPPSHIDQEPSQETKYVNVDKIYDLSPPNSFFLTTSTNQLVTLGKNVFQPKSIGKRFSFLLPAITAVNNEVRKNKKVDSIQWKQNMTPKTFFLLYYI